MKKHTVLVPLDGSEFSQQVLSSIQDFLNPAADQIILFHVAAEAYGLIPDPPLPAVNEWREPAYKTHRDARLAKHPIYANQIRDSLAATVEGELQPVKHKLEAAGFTVSVVVKFGEPAQEILEFVEAEPVDLIAMTTHGRTGFSRLIMGSVAEKVLHKVSLPVLLLHPTKQPAGIENHSTKASAQVV
jgi:nucleotide-binding universal stress UspA family protein